MTVPYAHGARDYLRSRIGSPIPVNEKFPPLSGWTGWHGLVPSGADVEEWCVDPPYRNLGLRLADGVLGIDVDAYDGKSGRLTLAQLERELGKLPPTVRSTSRTDGVSGIRLYRVDGGQAWVGKVSATHGDGSVTEGIELVHYGHRYVMAWPSLHPAGGTYGWLDDEANPLGRVPTLDDLPELPAAWQERLRRGSAATAGQRADLRVGEAQEWLARLDDGEPCSYVRRVRQEIADSLAGDSRHDRVGERQLALIRAGAQGHRGVPTALRLAESAFLSALVGQGGRSGSDTSSEWRRLLEGGIAKVLGTPNDGDAESCRCLDRLVAFDPATGEVMQASADGPPTSAVERTEREAWASPQPLSDAPPPVDVTPLPPVLRDMVTSTALAAQTPVEVPLTFALGVLAATSRGAWDVVVTPGWNAGPTSLYAVTLADSGERKSAGAAPLRRPLEVCERELAKRVAVENRERKLREDRAMAAAKKARSDDDEAGELKALAVAAANRRRPMPALVLSDTTTEALGQHMEEQGGATALLNTEATAFATVAGQYSDKGRAGNVGLLNHAYDAERFADKRVKRAGVTIQRPFLAWAAAVQTEVLTGYANGTTEGSGFLARFLMFLPESMVGTRTVRTDPIPQPVADAWASSIAALHARAWEHYAAMTDDPEDFGDPLVITFTSEAADRLLDYMQALENRKRTDTSLTDLGSWIEKHPARLARLSALFALLDNPYAVTVELRHLTAAMSLSASLIAHATATMRVLRNTSRRGPVSRVLAALKALGSPVVTTTDVHLKVRGQAWVEGADNVREQLAELERLGYVRLLPKVSTGGRPSERWELHPALVEPTSLTFMPYMREQEGGSELPPTLNDSSPLPSPQQHESHESPEPTQAPAPDDCEECGGALLLKRPGRTVCSRCELARSA